MKKKVLTMSFYEEIFRNAVVIRIFIKKKIAKLNKIHNYTKIFNKKFIPIRIRFFKI